MAYSKELLKSYDLDSSDMIGWASSGPTLVFLDEIESRKAKALADLVKGGEKNHDKNVELYRAYSRVMTLIDDAKNL